MTRTHLQLHPLLAIAVLLLAALPSRAAQQPLAEFIFQPGSTSFPSSHASTLVELHNHDLLAAWFGGSAEKKPDVAIWSARRTSQGWSKPIELVREKDIACWNPVLFHTADGRLWLYYKFGTSPSSWTAGRRYSTDDGLTWSPVEHLPAGLIGPARTKPLVLSNGVIVSGSSVEAYHSWAVWIERSTDNGLTWTKIGPIVPTSSPETPPVETTNPTHGIIQPTVLDLGHHHLRLYARSTPDIAKICIADSFDDGLTWTLARPIDVPNPNSGIDAVALHDGRVVLIYNDTPHGRTPLNLAVSTDGLHFSMFKVVEHDPGEFSYPAIIQLDNGNLAITYTWNRKTIKFVEIPQKEVPRPND